MPDEDRAAVLDRLVAAYVAAADDGWHPAWPGHYLRGFEFAVEVILGPDAGGEMVKRADAELRRAHGITEGDDEHGG